MAAVYRERISDDRLRAVADYVRSWLYARPAAKSGGKAERATTGKVKRPSRSKTPPQKARASAERQGESFALRVVG